VGVVVMQAAKGRLYGGDVHGPLAAVARIGGQCRALWNLFLAETRDRYEAEGKFVLYAEMSARLPALLKSDPRLIGLPHRAAQMTVQKLDRALRDCAKAHGSARKGFPRFKRRSDRADAFSFVGREVRVAPGRIRLPRIGWVRVRGLRLPENADLKQVAVTQEPRGWHVSIQFEAAPKTYAAPTGPVVGSTPGFRPFSP
jgi:putative transposase